MSETRTSPKPRIGLLPLYLALYDRIAPEARERIDGFARTIAEEFGKRGVDVTLAPVCRLRDEFASAVESFEKAGMDAIVTLHTAYSPSLESAGVLAGSPLPVIVLDTTPTFEFGPEQAPDEVTFNHGIHGVQDMCNLLIRLGKPFQIEAGHWSESDVIDRVMAWIRAARLASRMRSARVGRIGPSFAGMGDFAVPPEVMRETIGIETVAVGPEVIGTMVPGDDDPEVAAEVEADLARFAVDASPEAHRKSVRVSLAVRTWMERERLTGFTMNFDEIHRSSGILALPFLEASKAMARGQGYAGEGDVLTAALVGALASVYRETTFTEMFCPDWAGESIYLSHMGEVNPDVFAGKASLIEEEMSFLNTDAPALVVGKLKAGKAVFVNLAPGPEDTFTLILAPVEMLDSGEPDAQPRRIRGWFRPGMPIADFLAGYSTLGGTHHAAMVYGDVVEDLARFGELMGWDVAVLG